MEEILNNINACIEEYRDMDDTLVFNDAQKLSAIMKNLSSNLFFLERNRDEISRDFYTTIHNLKMSGESATGSEKEAKYQHPEKRQIDRYITSAYKVLDAIRSNISYLKHEN